MIRQIIHIDEEKCNGCGICANACHEGAIDIINGKAKLVREHFCDGFGDCLPGCPTGAITFEEREAPAYDEAAVRESQQMAENAPEEKSKTNIEDERQNLQKRKNKNQDQEGQGMNQEHGSQSQKSHGMDEMSGHGHHAGGGCPGSAMMQFGNRKETAPEAEDRSMGFSKPVSRLEQWPVQIKLLPVEAAFYNGAKLLIAADCTAYAYANLHEDFMKGKVTLIGCPKLDDVDYTEKLTEIIKRNDIQSVTIVRMEVPCCGGLQMAAQNALQASGKFIPWQVVTISRDGRILD